MKNTSIQVKIGFMLGLAVMILSATSYLSYRNLSSIVTSLQTSVTPELSLLTIQDISNDIEHAGNSIRLYTITKDTADLNPYYTVISGIDEKINGLKSECSGNALLLEQIDTITLQIENSIILWNEMLYLTKNDIVAKELKNLAEKINSVSESSRNQEKGILKRVFSGRNKKITDDKELLKSIEDIEKQDRITRDRMRYQESKLADLSNEITNNLYSLISKIEEDMSLLIRERAASADRLAGETYKWLIIFSVSGGFLAFFLLLVIIRFIRSSRESQIALERRKKEAEALARTKEMFMANMSHELRTPVTAISGFTAQLLHEPLDENTNRILKIIKSSSDHLIRIINDILDFSKLQNNKVVLEKEHFRTEQILKDVHATFDLQAQSNNTKLNYSISPDTPAVLKGDPYRLKQVIFNLVSNAVKFTRDGEVMISVGSIRKQRDDIDLRLEITDTGVGIDEKNLQTIFDDFTQEEVSTSRKYGGTGLGLSIVKKIVELHNGKIECISTKNKGTTIICIMPFKIGVDGEVRSEISVPISIPDRIRDLKILIVEDDEFNRMLFKKILDRWEIKYEEASNGAEAIEKLRDTHFNMLFMDVRMPEINGMDATRYIRDQLNISKSEMPVVCISAVLPEDGSIDYEGAGMNAFLQKPFTEEMLLTLIIEMLNKNPGITEINYMADSRRKTHPKDKINLHNLYHISGGDEQFVKQMLVSFIFTTKKGLDDLQVAVTSGDEDKAAAISHKLLAPCRHLGAMDLYNLLLRIERGTKNKKNSESVKTLTINSVKAFEVVSDLLNEHITKIAGTGEK